MLAGCINLTAVSISLSNPIIACNMFTIPGDGTFYGENMRLYVPCGARDAYVASSWSEWFSEITEECPINQISIEIESNGGGNLSLSTTEAAQGDEVLVYVTIDDGYEIDYIIAYNENDPTQTIPITRVDSRYVLTYKIIMPAFPVKIEARFREVSGVEESEIANIGLYPNPVGNTLNITSSETISEIEIVNAMGQVVYRMEVNADNAVCNVEELTNGIYVVRIRTQSQGAEIQRKFIKE
ncbi:MAG: T9SS type A sorting domain-containing protein [Bacteroidales bacterium]|nr:T9SS type A sorting domain-containing protein [Bacteroidales bacterium]